MTAVRQSSWRNALLAKVHVAKKQLGWDDETYRSVLVRLFNVSSAATLNLTQLDQVLDEMKRHGWRESKSWQRGRIAEDVSREAINSGNSDIVSKLRALWISLHHLGLIRDPKDSALLAFAQRQTKSESIDRKGVRSLTWLKPEEAQRITEALKDMARQRGGVVWDPKFDPRVCVLQAIANRCVELGIFQFHGQLSGRAFKYFGKSAWLTLARDEMDALMKILGGEIRSALAKKGETENDTPART